jgi:hypothetical protein
MDDPASPGKHKAGQHWGAVLNREAATKASLMRLPKPRVKPHFQVVNVSPI